MVRAISACSSDQRQPYFPVPSARLLASTAPPPLVDSGCTILPSHSDGVDYDDDHWIRPGFRFVTFDEWWATEQWSAFHDPPYAAYYPPLVQSSRRLTHLDSYYHDPCDEVDECYPAEWLSVDAAPQHYPSPAHHAHTVAAYNAAVGSARRALQPASPRAQWVLELVTTLTVVGLPPLLWRMQNKRYRALQAFRREVIHTLRQANDELDSEWRRRRATHAEVDESSERRWQWRWIGVQRNSRRNHARYRTRPQLALVHIASPSL